MSLINWLIELYLVVLIIRFLLEWFSANEYNPFVRWCIKLSRPVTHTLGRLLPVHSNINWGLLVGILLIKLVELSIVVWLVLGHFPHLGGLVIWALGSLLGLTLIILFWAMLLQAILSWVATVQRGLSHIQEFLYYLTYPILSPIKQIIPNIGPIDISPIVAIILLNLINRYLIAHIVAFGIELIH